MLASLIVLLVGFVAGYVTSGAFLRFVLVAFAPTVLLPLLLSVAVPAFAQVDFETARFERHAPAVRAAGPIDIDGVLNEEEWAGAPLLTDFIQSNPNEGMPATLRTEVRILYDDDFLYVGAVAYGDPDALVVNDLSRDFTSRSGDVFGVTVDSLPRPPERLRVPG